MAVTPTDSPSVSQRLRRDIKIIENIHVLVCVPCSQCIWVNELSTHLSQPTALGHSKYTLREAEEAEGLAKGLWPMALGTFSQLDALQEIVDSRPPAFSHLDVLHDGVKCPECNHVNPKWSSLRKHISLAHKGSKHTSKDCEHVSYQRLFASRQLSSYFAVELGGGTVEEVADDQPSFVDAMQNASRVRSKLIEESERIIDGSTTDQVSAFLKRARFHTLFARCERNALCNASKLPPRKKDVEIPENGRPDRRVHLVRAVLKCSERCAQSVRLAGSALRRELRRSSPTPTTVPFPVPNDATIATYGRTCARIIIFLLSNESGAPITFTPDQKKALLEVRLQLNKSVIEKNPPEDIHTNASFFEAEDEIEDDFDDDDEEEDEDDILCPTAASTTPVPLKGLEETCFAFLVSLLCQQTRNDDSESPLIVALSALAAQPTGWLRTGIYTKHLAAIMAMGNIFLYQKALRDASSEGSSSPNTREHLLRLKDQFGVSGTGSPMDWAMSLHAFGMAIHLTEGNVGAVSWDGDRITFRGIGFSMDEFRHMINGMVDRAESYFEETLLLGFRAPAIPWEKISSSIFSDDGSVPLAQLFSKYGFPSGAQWLSSKIQGNDDLRSQYLGADGKPKVAAVNRYAAFVDMFLDLFIPCVHITGGQPPRATELLSALIRNTAQGGLRSFTIWKGKVCMTLTYNKTGNRTISRFLPRRLGNLLLLFLLIVQPFYHDLLAVHPDEPATAASPYLVNRSKTLGRIGWKPYRLSNLLRKNFATIKCEKVGTAMYRQIAVAIARKYTPGLTTGPQPKREGTMLRSLSSHDNDVQNLMETLLDEQAGHSTAIARLFYGVAMGAGGAPTRDGFCAATEAWHAVLGFYSDTSLKPKVSPADDARQKQEARLRGLRDIDLDATFRAMLGSQASLRPKQREALRAVINGHRSVSFVAGTSYGKSILFLLVAFSGYGGLSIVIVPYRALQRDLLERCRRLDIAAAIWTSQRSPPPGLALLFVTPESFVKEKFQSWMGDAIARRELDHIFVDEAHERFASFRSAWRIIGNYIDYTVQLNLTTATASPNQMKLIWEGYGQPSGQTTNIRAITTMKNISYRVRHIGHGPALADVFASIRDELVGFHQRFGQSARAFIFIEDKELIDGIAGLFGRDVARAYWYNSEDGEDALEALKTGMCRYLVSTTSTSSGIDVSLVEGVFIWAKKGKFSMFIQMGGRCGRDDNLAQVTLFSGKHIDWKDTDSDMDDFVATNTCRRSILDRMDGLERSAGCEADEAPCDLCAARRTRFANTTVVPDSDLGSEGLPSSIGYVPEVTGKSANGVSSKPATGSPQEKSRDAPEASQRCGYPPVLTLVQVPPSSARTSPPLTLPSSGQKRPADGAGPSAPKRRRTDEAQAVTHVDAARNQQITDARRAHALESLAQAEQWLYELEKFLLISQDFCLACGSTDHPLHRCEASADARKAVADALDMWNGKKWEPTKFCSCKWCCAPQFLCQRWQLDGTRFVKLSNVRCSYYGLMPLFLFMWRRSGPVFWQTLPRLSPGCREVESTEELIRHVGSSSRKGDYKDQFSSVVMMDYMFAMWTQLESKFGPKESWGVSVLKEGWPSRQDRE